MKFRPCIDLHDGKVKQIVGSSLTDDNSRLTTNFTAEEPPEFYARMYRRDGLFGGHAIMLGPNNDKAAERILNATPDFMQLGGGINIENAKDWLDKGAAKLIVTSWFFNPDGTLNESRLNEMKKNIGTSRIVMDLSCTKQANGKYFAAINRWQTITDLELSDHIFRKLSDFASEFLIHAVNVEGKRQGIDQQLVEKLGQWSHQGEITFTYAGGISDLRDIELINQLGNGDVDFTIGSALDIFGGDLQYDQVKIYH